jgi:hypothetical protein
MPESCIEPSDNLEHLADRDLAPAVAKSGIRPFGRYSPFDGNAVWTLQVG